MTNSEMGARVVSLMAAAQIEGGEIARVVARNFTEQELIEGLRYAGTCAELASRTSSQLARVLGERCRLTAAGGS